MPLIKQEIIDRIIETASVVDVAQQLGLDLKRSGSGYVCKSPFNDEKSPSCNFSERKNIFKDFSSGEGGGPVVLVERVKGMTWLDAIKWLADLYRIEVEFEQEDQHEEEKRHKKEDLYRLLEAAKHHYIKALKALPKSHPAKKYVDARFSQEQQAEWCIGYAPEGWDFITARVKEKGLLEVAINAGLVKQKEGDKTFDFYRDRVMFPIHDQRGRVVSFGGRVHPGSELGPDGKKQPKYLNGPETEVFNKSVVLYGLDGALKAIKENKCVYLVEGYTDVISMHGAEAANTVASCGTSITKAHITILKKYTNHLVTFRDNDLKDDGSNPGEAATIRDVELCMREGMRVSVIRPEPGEDPDSMVKNYMEEVTNQ